MSKESSLVVDRGGVVGALVSVDATITVTVAGGVVMLGSLLR